jgi:hypothetical protein
MNSANPFPPSTATTTQTSFRKKASSLNGSLGFKNILMLFFSAMAVSLVVLVLFFGVFFQKLDFSLHTKPLENVPTVIDPVSDETNSSQNTVEDSQLSEAFNEININVPTDAYKIAKQERSTTEATATQSTRKAKPTEAYVGVGARGSSESASDVQVETAPPLPRAITTKTTPVAESNANRQAEEVPANNEPDFMPMTPVPAQE